MKVVLEIADDKANALVEVLKSIPYVKVKSLTAAKAKLMGEVKEAAVERKLAKARKKRATHV